jgi:predicted phage tail protein
MKEVILNGFIGEKYGRDWKVKANNVTDVFSCIEANYPSFRKDMIEYLESGGDVSVQSGDRFIEEEDLLYSMPEDTMVITPIPAGAKGGGAKLLLGALLVASLFIPGTQALFIGAYAQGSMLGVGVSAAGAVAGGATLNLAGLAVLGLGASLALAGISQIMAPKIDEEGPGANTYLFNGPENTVAQNNVVPVLFGEMIIGGVTIASGTVSGLQNRSYSYTGTGGGGGLVGGGTFATFDTSGGTFTEYRTLD